MSRLSLNASCASYVPRPHWLMLVLPLAPPPQLVLIVLVVKLGWPSTLVAFMPLAIELMLNTVIRWVPVWPTNSLRPVGSIATESGELMLHALATPATPLPHDP